MLWSLKDEASLGETSHTTQQQGKGNEGGLEQGVPARQNRVGGGGGLDKDSAEGRPRPQHHKKGLEL